MLNYKHPLCMSDLHKNAYTFVRGPNLIKITSDLSFIDRLQCRRSEETLYGSLASDPTFVYYEYLMIRVYI